jgi:hypothetical protein
MIYLIIYGVIALLAFIAIQFLFWAAEQVDPQSIDASETSKFFTAVLLANIWPILLIIFLISFLISKNK